jgi:hypothetical protein
MIDKARRLCLLTTIVAVVSGLAACGTGTDSSPAAQRQVCASLDETLCGRAIEEVILTAPDLGRAAIAVAAPRFDPPPVRFGGNTKVLVAFLNEPGGDTLPAAWVATLRLPDEWLIEPWREGPLPAHFLQAIEAAERLPHAESSDRALIGNRETAERISCPKPS